MRTVLFLTILVSLMCSLSCDRDETKSTAQTAAQTTTAPEPKAPAIPPDEIAIQYYGAMAAGRVHDAYEFVSEADRAAKSVEEFRAAASDPLQLAIIKRRKYDVKDVVVEGDKARVDIDTTGPDIAALQKKVIAGFQEQGSQLPDAEGLKRAMEIAVGRDKAPMVVTNNTLYFVLEDGEWKLDFDWDGPRPNRVVPLKQKASKDAGSAAD